MLLVAPVVSFIVINIIIIIIIIVIIIIICLIQMNFYRKGLFFFNSHR